MALTPSQGKAHVPAWKKLGLKLKYAKEDADSPSLPVGEENVDTGKKRKISSNERSRGKDGRESKKSKAADTTPSNTNLVDEDASKADTPSPTKRKSVSFTPETKKEDGDGVDRKIGNWFKSEKAQRSSSRLSDASKQPESVTMSVSDSSSEHNLNSIQSSEITSPSLSVDNNQQKAKKKAKKGKKTASKSETSASDVTSALSYLIEYQTSPSSWKFSKAHQSRILKHLFNLSLIPPSYDSVIPSYLQGLASTAARSRIRDRALELRKEDEEAELPEISELSTSNDADSRGSSSMDYDRIAAQNQARRKQEYQNAVMRMKSVLEAREDLSEEFNEQDEWNKRLQKRRRAEAVLWAVGENADSDSLTSPKGKSSPRSTLTLNAAATGGSVQGASSTSQKSHVETLKPSKSKPQSQSQSKKQRKRKRSEKDRALAIPDDFSTSSDTDTDSDSNSNSNRNRTSNNNDKIKVVNDKNSKKAARIKRKQEKAERERREEEERERQRERLAERRRELENMRKEAEENLDSSDASDGGYSETETVRGG